MFCTIYPFNIIELFILYNMYSTFEAQGDFFQYKFILYSGIFIWLQVISTSSVIVIFLNLYQKLSKEKCFFLPSYFVHKIFIKISFKICLTRFSFFKLSIKLNFLTSPPSFDIFNIFMNLLIIYMLYYKLINVQSMLFRRIVTI